MLMGMQVTKRKTTNESHTPTQKFWIPGLPRRLNSTRQQLSAKNTASSLGKY